MGAEPFDRLRGACRGPACAPFDRLRAHLRVRAHWQAKGALAGSAQGAFTVIVSTVSARA